MSGSGRVLLRQGTLARSESARARRATAACTTGLVQCRLQQAPGVRRAQQPAPPCVSCGPVSCGPVESAALPEAWVVAPHSTPLHASPFARLHRRPQIEAFRQRHASRAGGLNAASRGTLCAITVIAASPLLFPAPGELNARSERRPLHSAAAEQQRIASCLAALQRAVAAPPSQAAVPASGSPGSARTWRGSRHGAAAWRTAAIASP